MGASDQEQDMGPLRRHRFQWELLMGQSLGLAREAGKWRGRQLCWSQGGVGGGVGGGGGADIMSKTPEALPCPLLSWESDINHNHICERVIITVQCQEGFRDIRVGVKKDFPEKKYVSIYSLSTHLCLDPRRRLRGP